MKNLEYFIKLFHGKPKYLRFLLEVYPQVSEKTKIELSEVYSHRLMRKVLKQLGYKIRKVNLSKNYIHIIPK